MGQLGNGSAWVCKHPVVDGLDCSALRNQGSNRENEKTARRDEALQGSGVPSQGEVYGPVR